MKENQLRSGFGACHGMPPEIQMLSTPRRGLRTRLREKVDHWRDIGALLSGDFSRPVPHRDELTRLQRDAARFAAIQAGAPVVEIPGGTMNFSGSDTPVHDPNRGPSKERSLYAKLVVGVLDATGLSKWEDDFLDKRFDRY